MKLVIAVMLAVFTTVSYAEGDAAAGKTKAATCGACHGADGYSAIPGYPHLAGQDAAYMVAQLKAFKSGERKGGNAAIMAPMTAALSEQDMMDLAAYYKSLGKK